MVGPPLPPIDTTGCKTPITPLHWKMILDGIHLGQCVPFLGAAANISSVARNYTGLPMGPDVALQMIAAMIGMNVNDAKDLASVEVLSESFKKQELDTDLARLWVQNLPRVALHLLAKSNWDYPTLAKELRTILSEDNREPSHLLCVLAQLPLRLMISTNFDQLLERAVDAVLLRAAPFVRADVLKPAAVAARLKAAREPIVRLVADQLAPDVRQLVDTFDPAVAPSDVLVDGIVLALNEIVKAPSLQSSQNLNDVLFSDVTRRLIENGAGSRVPPSHLNRLLLEDVFPGEVRQGRRGYEVLIQPVGGFKLEDGQRHQTNPPPSDMLTLYKLHGSFPSDPAVDPTPSRILITEDDYVEFLTVVNDKVRGVPNFVLSRFIRNPVLFLGYSLEDWDFRMLYKTLIEPLTKDEKRTAFAIQWKPPKFWTAYWEKKGVVIYDCDIYDFADDLEKLYVARFGSLGASASDGKVRNA